jgi:toxin HigB-1
MDITFASKALEKLVSDAKQLNRKFGQFAPYVQRRFDLLRQARTLADVPSAPPPRRHQLGHNKDETFAVDVKTKADKWRIEFVVANNPIPRKNDGGIELKAVTAIEIVNISDHYK